jgi:SAM-dependent methyltransferase
MSDDRLREHYESLYEKYGDSPEAVQYSSVETQEKRFQVLSEISDLMGSNILDFGCGLGHFGQYLNSNGIEVDYNGVDIVPRFIDHCRRTFPKGNFGFLHEFAGKKYDFVFVSGVFNNRMEDNWSFFREKVRNLFDMAHVGLSFNLMSSYVDYQDEQLFYVRPEEIFKFIKEEITPFVTVRNDYSIRQGIVPFDFTVYAYRSGR